MSEQPKASREITPTTGRKDRALEANGVAWNIMSEHQRETAFLRQCILYDDTGERHKLEESITQLQRNELCVRRVNGSVLSIDTNLLHQMVKPVRYVCPRPHL